MRGPVPASLPTLAPPLASLLLQLGSVSVEHPGQRRDLLSQGLRSAVGTPDLIPLLLPELPLLLRPALLVGAPDDASHEASRVAGYSVLADFLHTVHQQLPWPTVAVVIDVYGRFVQEDTLPAAVLSTSLRLVAGFLDVAHANRLLPLPLPGPGKAGAAEAAAAAATPYAIADRAVGRALLTRLLAILVGALGRLRTYIPKVVAAVSRRRRRRRRRR